MNVSFENKKTCEIRFHHTFISNFFFSCLCMKPSPSFSQNSLKPPSLHQILYFAHTTPSYSSKYHISIFFFHFPCVVWFLVVFFSMNGKIVLCMNELIKWSICGCSKRLLAYSFLSTCLHIMLAHYPSCIHAFTCAHQLFDKMSQWPVHVLF